MTTQNLYGTPIANTSIINVASAFTSNALNAANQAVGSFFIAESGHGDIVGLRYNVISIATPPTYRFSLQGITSRATPDGIIKGVGNSAFVDVSPGATGVATATFGTSYSPTAQQALAAVCIYQSGTVDGTHTMTLAASVVSQESPQSPYVGLDTAGTWAVELGAPALAPIYNDGYVGRTFAVPSTVNSVLPNSTSNPLYYGTKFTPSITCTCSGAIVVVRPAAGSNFTVSIFEGTNTTAISSTTVNPDLNAESTSVQRNLFVPLPSVTLTAGTVYRIVFSMTTGTSFATCYMLSFLTAADIQAYFGVLTGTTGSSGGLTWTDYDSGADWRAYPVVPCIDTLTAAAGGGMLVHPGMSGGTRG